MSTSSDSAVISHWHYLIEGFHTSPKEFYTQVEAALQKREIPNIRISRIDWKEGGMFSAKREYLRVQRGEYTFDICGAHFGQSFFVSWWLIGEAKGCLSIIPIIGRLLVGPETYFKIDTALMFRESVRLAVNEVIDNIIKEGGLRALSEADRKPVMREFFMR